MLSVCVTVCGPLLLYTPLGPSTDKSSALPIMLAQIKDGLRGKKNPGESAGFEAMSMPLGRLGTTGQ